MSDTTVIRQAEGDVAAEDAASQRVPGPPRIGLMGEFSAGKTTLINFLLGEDLLPTRVTATQMPPVWIGHGPREAYYVDVDGNRNDIDLSELATISVEGVRYVRLTCDAEILREFELFDTPGISDPNIPDQYRQAVVDFVDGVIWCTHAPQAWRESERSAWAQMPERLQRTSVLLATRADKLVERDRARVAARLRHEAAQSFRDIILFSTLDAIRACQMEDGTELFATSGAEQLIGLLRGIAGEIAAGPAPLANLADNTARDINVQGDSGGGVVVPLQPSRVRPARVARATPNGRPRGDRTEPVSFAEAARDTVGSPAPTPLRLTRSFAVPDDDSAAEEASTRSAPVIAAESAMPASGEPDLVRPNAGSDILDLTGFLVSQPDISPTGEGDVANNDGDTDEIAVVAMQRDAEADADPAPRDDIPVDEANLDDPPVLSSIGRAIQWQENLPEPEPEINLAGPEPSVVAPSASAIWDDILAEANVRSVAQVLAAVGRLIERLEAEGMLVAAPLAEVDRRTDGPHR
jgi:hypothetical protein